MLPKTKRPVQVPTLLGDWWRFLIMGAVLLSLVFVTLFYEPKSGIDNSLGPPVGSAPRSEIPTLDVEVLAEAKDATRSERLILEPEPFAHVLERSLRVVPAVTAELGMPTQPIPVTSLRAAADDFRGRYLWYKGVLGGLSTGNAGHPVDGYQIYEGWLVTEDDETVLFAVSVPPTSLKKGDFVRVEGFFLKLRDKHHLPACEQAPLLVGPELFEDYADWNAVESLDSSVLARVRDGRFVNAVAEDYGDMELGIDESQDVPLWHLASYASAHVDDLDAYEWRQVPALTTKSQLDKIKYGQFARGDEIRVLGTFVQSRTIEARPNPLGIRYWTEAWVQIRDLGGKLVPVWIPDRIASSWRRNSTVDCRAYYYRGMVYEPVAKEKSPHERRWTPVFVSARLDPFRALPPHPAMEWVKWGFLALVVAVIGVFFGVSRRDKNRRNEHEDRMTRRRRRWVPEPEGA